jgi:hypothetical protein
MKTTQRKVDSQRDVCSATRVALIRAPYPFVALNFPVSKLAWNLE